MRAPDLVPADNWECPCGREGKSGFARTLVAIREPRCPFCGRAYKDEFRVPREDDLRDRGRDR